MNTGLILRQLNRVLFALVLMGGAQATTTSALAAPARHGARAAAGQLQVLTLAAPAASQFSSPLLAASTNATPAVYAWAKTWGGTSASTMAKGIAVDGAGNTYVVGEFCGTVDFDPAGSNPGATITSNNLTVDAFLSKFDSTGTLQWVRTWGGAPAGTPVGGPGGPDGRDAANGVALDGAGNVYVVGLYQNTVNFGGGIVYTSNAASGANNIFVAKFNGNGTTQWARTWGGTSGGEGYSVVVDKVNGAVYVEGDWSTAAANQMVDFNPGGPTHDWHTNHGFYDAFLSKFDLNGDFQWANTWGGHGYDDGPGVAVDSRGNIYVGGMYGSEDNINFDPSGATNTGGLGHAHGAENPVADYTDVNVFLSKFNSAGRFQWVRTWGGLHSEDAGEMVTVDGADNAYIGGRFQCTNCNFNAGPTGPAVFLSSNGDRDAFISKYDSSGNFLWARTWGGSGWDSVGGLAVDAANNVFATGFFVNTVDFNQTGGGDSHVSHGGRDVFLNKFDSGGNFQWVKAWGGTGDDLGLALALDMMGNPFVAGSFAGPADFDPGSGVDNHTALGSADAFFSKFLAAPLPDTTVTPEAGGSMTLTTPLTTCLMFPPGAVASTVTITEGLTNTFPLPAGKGAVGPDFYLEAHDSGGAAVTQFSLPYTVTIHYSDADMFGVSETTLKLYYWDTQAQVWQVTPTVLDTAANTLTAVLNHLNTFALIGDLQPMARIYLPIVIR
jgi:hypothetical protein